METSNTEKQKMESGVYNASLYLHDMLQTQNIESQISMCIDNNCIEKYVFNYRPTHVMIEALWVVPEKVKLLQSLYPNIIWIIRYHSEMPFIASEGIGMKWFFGYINIKNVMVAANGIKIYREFKEIIKIMNLKNDELKKIIYLPNYYPSDFKIKQIDKTQDNINISCFGAIRPLKNHLIQAVAAIEFSKKINKKLRFHINYDRLEMNGMPNYHNLRDLFIFLGPDYELVCHPWNCKKDFFKVIEEIDIGMQVSFSETFNIVAADLISNGVPLLCSNELPWSINELSCSTTDSKDIVNKLLLLYNNNEENLKLYQESLKKYSNITTIIWNINFK